MTPSFDLNILVGAAATLLGTLIAGVFNLISGRRQDKWADLVDANAKLSHDLARAADQVAAYHALEAEYAADLAAQRRVSPRTIKTEYRDRVEERGYSRPKWTEDRARLAFEAAAESGG